MLSDYELKIGEDNNICIGNVKKLAPNFVDKENFVETFFITWIKNKKSTSCIRILSIKVAETYMEFNTQKKNRSRKKMVTKIRKHSTN